ncbi:hypothetical protein [Thiorhodococcus mannitoliphagus]|uniref:hypothetical protein n=1 Tax=Thiorhodococcus mannitoliphagus TaxID=329406 RepID=UPI003B8303BF
MGLLTGEAGVGKTAALRRLTQALNPHRYEVIYLAETDFGRLVLPPTLFCPQMADVKLLPGAWGLAPPDGVGGGRFKIRYGPSCGSSAPR